MIESLTLDTFPCLPERECQSCFFNFHFKLFQSFILSFDIHYLIKTQLCASGWAIRATCSEWYIKRKKQPDYSRKALNAPSYLMSALSSIKTVDMTSTVGEDNYEER